MSCPGRFCFHWVDKGDKLSWDLRGIPAGTPHLEAGCGLPSNVFLTRCDRDTAEPGPIDMYEPNEPELDKAGLSWNHFDRPMIWTATQIWTERADGEDVLVPYWKSPDGKWAIIEEPLEQPPPLVIRHLVELPSYTIGDDPTGSQLTPICTCGHARIVHGSRCFGEDDGPCACPGFQQQGAPSVPLKPRTRTRDVGRYIVKLGMIGPNYEKHGQRFWVKVWRSDTLEEAQRTVERQERNPKPGPPHG